MVDRFDVEGRRTLVTGGSEGIGRAITLALAERGAVLAVHGHEASTVDAVCEEAAAFGRPATGLVADLSTPRAGTRLAGATIAALGAVDILVSTVAIQTRMNWTDVPPEDFEKCVAVNLQSAFELFQALVPPMVDRRWGRVITMGSIQQIRPHPMMPVYAATKSAQLNIIKSLARQHARDGVTFNNIAPGVIETKRNSEVLADPAYRAQVVQAIPAGVIGEPDDIAGAVLLLCSASGRYITGQDLFIDGGMSA